MMDKTTIREGLFELPQDVLQSVILKESIREVYDVDTQPLGRGKYATVCRAVHKKTKTSYAAKFVRKRRRNQDQVKETIHEIAVLMQCTNTSRVIRLHEVYESSTEMVLVLELAAGGELQHILDSGQCLSESEARKAMRQILEGVAYLHDKNIAHLDLKPQNLLLTEKNSVNDIKLCDFGISKVLHPGVTVREILGTLDYVAPEVLSYEPISLSTDIWSIGVLAYVLLSGYSPFGSDDKKQTLLNISTCALSFEPEHFENVSKTAIDFIESALVVDPRNRPSIHDLLDHPWISPKSDLMRTTMPILDCSQLPREPTPKTQRKSFSYLGEIPASENKDLQQQKNKRNTLSGPPLKSQSKHTYNTLPNNCTGRQCGKTCPHINPRSVSKSNIDRGIYC